MAGRISDETLQAIRDRLSIVEVVSGYVSLKKAGKNHVGLCPFHSEKSPSFTVSDERGLFHCFGCGAGGTVYTFVMRADRVTFPEAVELLARRAGVALPARAGRGDEDDRRRDLLEVHDVAQRCFRAALQSTAGARARAYLIHRGLSEDVVARYGVGFCPVGGSALGGALGGKPDRVKRAIDVGLVGRRSDGSLYERFRGRITFPIRNGRGEIVGFGGRTMGDEQPKYLNSPESPVFQKGRVLYGAFEAREAIRAAGRVVVVEGYLDALSLAGNGIDYVVATLGTALSVPQLQLIRRLADEVIVFFDGDRAGYAAAERAFALCAEAGVWALGAFLPEGSDPDSFVRQQGAAATVALLQGAGPLADFFLNRAIPGPDAPIPVRARAVDRVASVLVHFTDPMFSLLVRQAAQRLGVDEAVFRDRKAAPGRRDHEVPDRADAAAAEVYPSEEVALVEAMALDREVALLVAHRGVVERLAHPALADLARMLIDAWARGGSGTAVLDRLPPVLLQRVSAGLIGEGAMATADRMQVAEDCIERIDGRARRALSRQVLARLRAAESRGDEQDARENLQRHADLVRNKEVGRD
jgi:DNA primase